VKAADAASQRERRALAARARQCWELVPPRQRRRWLALLPLAVLAALLEAVGAGAVFALLGMLNDPAAALARPRVAALLARLGVADARAALLLFTLAVGAFYVLKNAVTLLASHARHRCVEVSAAQTSVRMLAAYLRAPFAFHLRRNSAELIQNADMAVRRVFGTVLSPTLDVATELLVALGLFGVLLAAAPGVTLVIVPVLAGLAWLFLRATRGAVRRLGEQVERHSRDSLRHLQQALGAAREIKLRGREDFFGRLFERDQESLARARYAHATLGVLPRSLIETLFVVGALVVGLVVARRGAGDAVALPLLGLYAYAAFRAIPSLNRIVWRLNEIRFGAAAIGPVHADLVALSREGQAPSAVAECRFRDRLEVDDVAYAYEPDGKTVLEKVDVELRPGEWLGIVGATGAGKSTLVDLMIGLLDPMSGVVRVDGVDVRSCRAAWQRRIGYVPQSIYLLDDSLRRNIALGEDEAEIDETRLQDAVRCSQLEAFVASLPDGLATYVGERGARLSGGERQRVGIARALYVRPALLVLDEATAALDAATEGALIEALRGAPEPLALVLVTHRLATLRSCDRLLFLRGGRVEASGRFAELLAECPAFRALALASSSPQDGRAAD
jgi:ATP-binding cassette subfamily C protein